MITRDRSGFENQSNMDFDNESDRIEDMNSNDNGSESEYEEITDYVVLDLAQHMPASSVIKAVSTGNGVSITGLETASPIIRVGDKLFSGIYERPTGSDIILSVKQKENTHIQRPADGPRPLTTAAAIAAITGTSGTNENLNDQKRLAINPEGISTTRLRLIPAVAEKIDQ